MKIIEGLSKEESYLVWSILHNCEGYPMSSDNSTLLGFDKQLCGALRDKIFSNEGSPYKPTSEEQMIIIKSFEVFTSEIGIDTVPVTGHPESDVKTLYKKLRSLYVNL